MNFRKIVAHLAYSPAMIWHLAAYDTKIRHDRSHNVKIIIFALLNLIILTMAISLNNHHSRLPLTTPGLNTEPLSTSLSAKRLINNQSQIDNFSQLTFFSWINQDPTLSQIYDFFGINNHSVKQIEIVNAPKLDDHCQEINHSPINNRGKININNSMSVYSHNCLSQYQGLSFKGKTSKISFIILNNGNLLLSDIVNNSSPLSFSVNVVNSTTNSYSPSIVKDGQSLKYTITASNTSSQTINDVVKINLSDVTEYASVMNNALNDSQIIYWPIDSLNPGESAKYEIFAQINNLNIRPININSPTSNDCQIVLAVDKAQVSTNIACPPLKRFEVLSFKTFPPRSHDTKILIGVTLMLLAIIALKIMHIARINFISKEIRIIRHKINQGIM